MLRLCAVLCVVGWVVGALAACSSGATVASTDFDLKLSQAQCARAARCKTFPDEATCNTNVRVVSDPSVAAAITAGKIKYDGERAQQCIDAIAKQGCDLTAHDTHIPPAECTEMYTGTVKGGDSCSLDTECASGTCNLPDECPEKACCVGTCRATQDPAEPGGACAKGSDCAEGLVCGTDLTCHKPGADSAACGSDRECGDGLACVGANAQTPGHCHALGHAGDACPYVRCADVNLRCDATSHLCVAIGLPGDACPNGDECASGIECDPTSHMCRPQPTLGMPCDNVCGGDAFCMFDMNGANGMCVAPLTDGTPCDGYSQCTSFYCEQGALYDSCKDPYICI
jgi:hypothetical protein